MKQTGVAQIPNSLSLSSLEGLVPTPVGHILAETGPGYPEQTPSFRWEKAEANLAPTTQAASTREEHLPFEDGRFRPTKATEQTKKSTALDDDRYSRDSRSSDDRRNRRRKSIKNRRRRDKESDLESDTSDSSDSGSDTSDVRKMGPSRRGLEPWRPTKKLFREVCNYRSYWLHDSDSTIDRRVSKNTRKRVKELAATMQNYKSDCLDLITVI